MNKDTLVQKIKESLLDRGTKDLMVLYKNPPGRKPSQKLIRISQWLSTLKEEDQEIVRMVINDSIQSTIFGLFCILDGVRFLENEEEKTQFELYALLNSQRSLINKPDAEPLHDIFNSLVQE
jgi:hypothetical protein